MCKDCRENPKYKLIYKTTAKNKYYLTDKDIKQLKCFETIGYNGFSFRASLTLIKEIDVIRYFCKKHDIKRKEMDDKLDELENLKEERSNKREMVKK